MNTLKLYDFFSKIYDQFMSKRTLRKNERIILNDLFKKKIKSNDIVLEIGAGTGYFTLYVSTLCKKIIAVEPSKGMINQLMKKSKNQKNIIFKNKEFNDNLSIKEKFNTVIAIGVTEHINLNELINFFIKSKAKKAIFTFPTMTFSGFTMKLFFLLFGIRCNIYKIKDVNKFLINFKSIKYNLQRVPLTYFKHHTMVLEIDKY